MAMEHYLYDGGEWKSGQVLLVTSGAYDAYAVGGLYRVNQRITAEDLEPYFAEPRRVRGGKTFRDVYFVAWLVTHGYLEGITFYEWYMGDGYYTGSVAKGGVSRGEKAEAPL